LYAHFPQLSFYDSCVGVEWSGVGALFCFLLLRRTERCASSRLHLRAFFYQKIFKGKKNFQVGNVVSEKLP
jgi:hypothetical protein